MDVSLEVRPASLIVIPSAECSIRLRSAATQDPRVSRVGMILDSGADVSVMPSSWLSLGQQVPQDQTVQTQLMDAQGAKMPHHGQKQLQLDLGDIVVQKQFAATSVESPLLSLGCLFKKGWELRCFPEGDESVLKSYLCLGDEVRVPVYSTSVTVRVCEPGYVPSNLQSMLSGQCVLT